MTLSGVPVEWQAEGAGERWRECPRALVWPKDRGQKGRG